MSANEINTIYHYCSLDTFLNIIKYKTIRFSDVNKSNDYLESKAMVDLVKKATLELCEKSDLNDYNPIMNGVDNISAMKQLVEIAFRNILDNNDMLTYAACFSEERDLLSQWKEYADDGRGVAIGFNVNTLMQICKDSEEAIKLKKVSYTSEKNDEQLEIVNRYAKQFYDDIIYEVVNDITYLLNSSNCNFGFSGLTSKLLFLDSVFIKNKSYEPEKEWRMYNDDETLEKSYDDWKNYYNWKDRDNDANSFLRLVPNGIQFRSTGDNIVSFMDLSFKCYIEKIIDWIVIGPNCKLQSGDLYQIMNHLGFNFDYDQALKSECPYRNK